jgi:hypothetical protein
MRRFVLAAALVAAFAGGSLASDARDTVARKYGEAMAIAELCPTLAFNNGRATVYLAAANIAFDDTFKSVATVSHNRTLTDLYGKSADDVCLVGEALYGPEGTNGPRLLERK